MAYGLAAAVVAHLLILRRTSRTAKIATYVAGALVGGLTSLALNQ